MTEKKHSLSAMFFCALLIAWRSIIIMVRASFNKIDRAFVNRSIREGSLKLLHIVKAHYSIHIEKENGINDTLPRIYMSNHNSLFDLPLIMATLPGTIRLVVKEELSHIPLFGNALKQTEQLLVNRKHPEKMAAFFKDAKEKLKSGISLWIFPEGTRSKTSELLPFKAGGFRLARETGAQIIPVAILNTQELMPVGTLIPRLHQTVEIRIGHAIDCRLYSDAEQQKALMEKTREAILYLKTKA